jgi:hypothetical protein
VLAGRVSNRNLGTGRGLQDLRDLQHLRPGQVDAPSTLHAPATAVARLIDAQGDGMQQLRRARNTPIRVSSGALQKRFCSADCLNLDSTQHLAGLNNNTSSSVGVHHTCHSPEVAEPRAAAVRLHMIGSHEAKSSAKKK